MKKYSIRFNETTGVDSKLSVPISINEPIAISPINYVGIKVSGKILTILDSLFSNDIIVNKDSLCFCKSR